jgi:hypothetical protein
MTIFIELYIDSKHKCCEILKDFVVWIHNDFMLNSFKQMMSFFKHIQNDQKFFFGHEYHKV